MWRPLLAVLMAAAAAPAEGGGGGLQLTCGLLDIAPLLTKPEHLGAVALVAAHGPVDITCRKTYQSMWLLDTCWTLEKALRRLDTPIEHLNSICRLGSRKVRRSVRSCSGIDPHLHSNPLGYMARSFAATQKSNLFCSFVADCSLHAYMTACLNGIPMLQRLIDTCRSVPAVLAVRCRRNPDFAALNATAAPQHSIDALSQAFADALEVRPRLQPFVVTRSGFLGPVEHDNATVAADTPPQPQSAGKAGRKKRRGGGGGDDVDDLLLDLLAL